MSNAGIRTKRTEFRWVDFINDVQDVIESDDHTLNDHVQSWFVVRAFQMSNTVIGFENIPLSIIMDICDLTGLGFTDYIQEVSLRDLPF